MPDFTTTEASLGDIRSMLAPSSPAIPAEVPAAEPQSQVEEPEVSATESAPNSETGEPEGQTEDNEEQLPPGVQKRIAQEVARTLEINKAISARKAAQAELDKLSQTGKPGSEPAKTTELAATAKPVKPKPTDTAFDDDPDKPGSGYAKYQAALDKYDDDRDAWVQAETRRNVETEIAKRQAQEAVSKKWATATATHGADWPNRARAIAANTPEEIQIGISALEDWPAMVNHLGDPKNAAELEAVKETYAQTGTWGVAFHLGKIAHTLSESAKKEPDAAKPTRKALPDPLETVGGRPSHAAGEVDYEKSSFTAFQKDLKKRLTLKKAG